MTFFDEYRRYVHNVIKCSFLSTLVVQCTMYFRFIHWETQKERKVNIYKSGEGKKERKNNGKYIL